MKEADILREFPVDWAFATLFASLLELRGPMSEVALLEMIGPKFVQHADMALDFLLLFGVVVCDVGDGENGSTIRLTGKPLHGGSRKRIPARGRRLARRQFLGRYARSFGRR